MSLEKEFVPYELAVKLKELGFDEFCIATVNNIGSIHIKGIKRPPTGAMCTHEVYTPLWQQAFDFLLKKIDKGIRIWYDGSGAICSWKDDSIDICFNTKEEALYLLIEDYEKTCKSEN